MAVDALAAMSDPRASRAIARYAVYSPWQPVRQAAAQSLKPRDMDSYVPMLLSAMSSPVTIQAEVYGTSAGSQAYGLVYSRQRQYHEEVAPIASGIARAAPQVGPSGIPSMPTAPATVPLVKRPAASSTNMAMAAANTTIEQVNQRVAETLATSTGQAGLTTPEQWWQWWNGRNEVALAGGKPVRTITPPRYTALYMLESPKLPLLVEQPEISPASIPPEYRMPHECLAAGTPTWTDQGPQPIERVRVGDRVLSQDVESGCLTYKPVLTTSIRPPMDLIRIWLGGYSITATGGHPFWVAGQGWVKANELTPGMRLHRVSGSVIVDSVRSAGSAETYNLVVADYHTYFAGQDYVLTHDNSVRRPTNAILPGLRK